MWSFLQTLSSWIFPERVTQRLVRNGSSAALLTRYQPHTITGAVALMPYQETLVRACITEAKFHHSAAAIAMLAEVLRRALAARATPDTVYLPMPLSKQRFRERGYNQVAEVIRAALRPGNILGRLEAGWLKREHTKPQTSLARAQRLENVTGSFFLTASLPDCRTQHLILIDDVLTTGATMRAAAAALAPLSPASLTCLALAH